MDDPIENIDSSNDDIELDLDDNFDSEKLVETNKKLYERAKNAEAALKAVKAKPIIRDASPAQKPSDILKADEFKLYRQGYSESEIDLIMHNGGMKVLENEQSPLSVGLRVAREQRLAEDAAGKTSDASGLSEIERKFTVEDMKKMSTKELEDLIGFAK